MKQLSWTDAAMVRMESPNAPLHVNPVLIYDPSTAPDGRVTFTGLLRSIEDRLPLAPAFRRRLAHAPGGLIAPFWVDDPDFDLEFHVRHIRLPKPGDWRQFCIQVARLHARPLDLSRPPWELTVIEGLDNIDGLPKGCFAISLKVHHAAIDGVEGVALITAMHDLLPDPPESHAASRWDPANLPGTRTMLIRTMRSGVVHPLRMATIIGAVARPTLRSVSGQIRRRRLPTGRMAVPKTRFNHEISSHRVFEARFHNFEDIRKIKQSVAGATVNDVALAYVGGALRHYLSARGELPESSLYAVCPISTRTPDQMNTGGNRISAMRAAVRSEIADPLERLAAITAATSVDRAARGAVGAPALVDAAELLPGALLGIGSRATSLFTRVGPTVANVAMTNVPGSRVPLYFAGAKLVRSTGNGPIFNGFGLIHLISTYVGEFSCAITADRAMMPDPAFYAKCMQRSFDELLAATT